jgi:hypothetical protein
VCFQTPLRGRIDVSGASIFWRLFVDNGCISPQSAPLAFRRRHMLYFSDKQDLTSVSAIDSLWNKDPPRRK